MASKEKEVEQTQVKETQIKSDPELTQDQALNILVQSARLATKRGAFELEETEVILKAIKVFTPKQ